MKDDCRLHAVSDPRDLRAALGRFATGVTVVSTRSGEGRFEGLTVNSFSSVSLDPPLVLWSIRKNAPSVVSFRTSPYFAINVLRADQEAYCRHFATPSADKFAGVPFRTGLGGCPLLADSIASFECLRHDVVEGGDHWIVLGRVERAASREGVPLIFSSGAFHVPTPLRTATEDRAPA